MRFADMFKRPKRGATAAPGDAEPHHEEHAKSVQKEARKLWDVIGRNRHKSAKWH
ncbi:MULTISPECIES: hypothetical protein [Caballeronia]|jgi:hypothetical protein|uniref:hypothetical protein n=1 Tax=Caballeronia TaxID=1827195 RepID=UPI00025BAD9C|nr:MULTISPECIES: hypothetical protein [Caballeronia]EKS70847.1 hypothetical protein BURK_013053 [Burkholderia sp. SJ98]MDR5788753.1 hypothetical protein [Caballeronia sp. LP003]